MILGFTGTQEGMTAAQLNTVRGVLAHYMPDELHHGDCIGADAQMHELAYAVQRRIVLHPPVNQSKRARCLGSAVVMPQAPYLVRNRAIVDASDMLLAAPKGDVEELRSGTWSTVRYALRKKKPVLMVFPNGRMHVEQP